MDFLASKLGRGDLGGMDKERLICRRIGDDGTLDDVDNGEIDEASKLLARTAWKAEVFIRTVRLG